MPEPKAVPIIILIYLMSPFLDKSSNYRLGGKTGDASLCHSTSCEEALNNSLLYGGQRA